MLSTSCITVSARLSDLEVTLHAGIQHRNKALESVGSQLWRWIIMVKKEKAVYDTLNTLNFDVTKKCLVGEGWCPIFAKSQYFSILALPFGFFFVVVKMHNIFLSLYSPSLEYAFGFSRIIIVLQMHFVLFLWLLFYDNIFWNFNQDDTSPSIWVLIAESFMSLRSERHFCLVLHAIAILYAANIWCNSKDCTPVQFCMLQICGAIAKRRASSIPEVGDQIEEQQNRA